MREIPTQLRPALAALQSHLRGRFGSRLTDLRLFGSYSRGDARPDSDVDVLVVVDDLSRDERREIWELPVDLYFEFPVRISPLALSAFDYRAMIEREELITRDIADQGIPL